MHIRSFLVAALALGALSVQSASAQVCCPERASCTALGPGCAPAGRTVPALVSSRRPAVGTTARLSIYSPSTPHAVALVAIGFSTNFSPALGVSLPFDLGPVGFPGCSLYTSGEALAAVGLDNCGVGSYRIYIPARVKWCGQLLAFQAVVLGSANRMLASNGLACTVGN